MSGIAVCVTGFAVYTARPDLSLPPPAIAVLTTATPTATEPTPVHTWYKKRYRVKPQMSPASRDIERARPSPTTVTRTPVASKPTFTSIDLSPKRWKVIAAAETQLGDPYVWGGTGPDGWDCSGIIQWAFAQVGIAMPRVSSDQARMGRVTSVWNLHPGDLVAWSGHIALWLGSGQLLEAQRPGTTVHIRTFGSQGSWDDAAWGVALDYSRLS